MKTRFLTFLLISVTTVALSNCSERKRPEAKPVAEKDLSVRTAPSPEPSAEPSPEPSPGTSPVPSPEPSPGTSPVPSPEPSPVNPNACKPEVLEAVAKVSSTKDSAFSAYNLAKRVPSRANLSAAHSALAKTIAVASETKAAHANVVCENGSSSVNVAKITAEAIESVRGPILLLVKNRLN